MKLPFPFCFREGQLNANAPAPRGRKCQGVGRIVCRTDAQADNVDDRLRLLRHATDVANCQPDDQNSELLPEMAECFSSPSNGGRSPQLHNKTPASPK